CEKCTRTQRSQRAYARQRPEFVRRNERDSTRIYHGGNFRTKTYKTRGQNRRHPIAVFKINLCKTEITNDWWNRSRTSFWQSSAVTIARRSATRTFSGSSMRE